MNTTKGPITQLLEDIISSPCNARVELKRAIPKIDELETEQNKIVNSDEIIQMLKDEINSGKYYFSYEGCDEACGIERAIELINNINE